ncbi:uroporphyrinogen-III synthase [Candidatus Blochmanniella vafra str. BVAF]|uniref:Uroporphyrinogen-III synthase n=1 Tax=Blochmanniella vafra (strain BVAF) TaxID=859654 RepID=E8Q6J2_BLOVB|nr:uroporphyrinogen-III synthase [Candidatus Blochmannia vafer]ADV33961.1 uroporphyrinogen-III synthase [Candidatus Blochmannia vafer str. BVAF]
MNILVTRPSPNGEELVHKLLAIGKFAHHLPLIYFSSGKNLPLIKKYLNLLESGDLLFFLSQHAVKYAHFQLLKTGGHWPSTITYYSIGSRTSLKMYILSGISSKYPYNEETSENLLQFPELIQNISGRRALILKGNNGRTLLQNTLQQRGALVLSFECYTRNPIKYNGQEQLNLMLALNITTIVVTTKETLKQLYYLIPQHYRDTWLIQCQLIVVSIRLSKIAENLGWNKTNIIIAKSANNNAIFNILK